LQFKDRDLAMQIVQNDLVNSTDPFGLLDEEQQESVLSKIIESKGYLLMPANSIHYNAEAVNMLLRTKHLWSPGFSNVILKTLRTHLSQKNNYIFMDYILRHIALHMDCELWSTVAESWKSLANNDTALARMMTVLSMRKEMRDAIKSD
jgi:hypothetical protein